MKPIRTNVYRRKYDSGETIWMVRWRDPATNQWKAKKVGPSKDEALGVEAEVRRSLIMGLEPFSQVAATARPRTLQEVAEEYFESPVYLSTSKGWQHNIRLWLNNAILPKLGKKEFKSIDRKAIYDFYFELQARGLAN